MAQPVERQVVQDPNAGAALQSPQPVALPGLSLNIQSQPSGAAAAGAQVQESLGMIGDILGDKIKDNVANSVVDGQAAAMSGKAKESLGSDYYAKQSYDKYGVVNDTNVWYQQKLANMPQYATMDSDTFAKTMSTERAAYLDKIKDPAQKAIAVEQLAQFSVQLAGSQVQASSSYQKQQYSSTFGSTLSSSAGVATDSPVRLDGSTLAVSPTAVSVPLPGQLDATSRDKAIRTVLGEAGGEGDQGQGAVAMVIKNRVLDGQYGKGVYGVVTSPKQFSVWNAGAKGSDLDNIDPNSAAYRKAGAIVDAVFSGKVADFTGGATHYYAPKGMENGVAPSWYHDLVQRSGNNIQIGNHVFTGRAAFADGSGRVAPDPTLQEGELNTDVSKSGNQLIIPKSANIGGVDPRLTNIMRTATANWTEGRVEVSAHGGNNSRSAGTTNHSSGHAIDVILYDKDGNKIDNYQNGKTTAPYQRYANLVRRTQMQLNPELNDAMRWGGYFRGDQNAAGKNYGGLDLMHFDISGRAGLGMAGGSWDKGFSDEQKKIYGISNNEQGPGGGVVAGGGTPATSYNSQQPGGVNTSTVKMFESEQNPAKYGAAADQISSDLAMGNPRLFDAMGGINNLQRMGFTPDQLKAMNAAHETFVTKQQNSWNLDKFKEADQIVADAAAGGDPDVALKKIDGWVKTGYYDDGHAQTLANRVIEANKQFKNADKGGEYDSLKVAKLRAAINDKLTASVKSGGQYDAEAAVKEAGTYGLGDATVRRLTQDFFGTEKSAKEWVSNNPAANANVEKVAADIDRDTKNGTITDFGAAKEQIDNLPIDDKRKAAMYKAAEDNINAHTDAIAKNPPYNQEQNKSKQAAYQNVAAGKWGTDDIDKYINDPANGFSDGQKEKVDQELRAAQNAYQANQKTSPAYNKDIAEKRDSIIQDAKAGRITADEAIDRGKSLNLPDNDLKQLDQQVRAAINANEDARVKNVIHDPDLVKDYETTARAIFQSGDPNKPPREVNDPVAKAAIEQFKKTYGLNDEAVDYLHQQFKAEHDKAFGEYTTRVQAAVKQAADNQEVQAVATQAWTQNNLQNANTVKQYVGIDPFTGQRRSMNVIEYGIAQAKQQALQDTKKAVDAGQDKTLARATTFGAFYRKLAQQDLVDAESKKTMSGSLNLSNIMNGKGINEKSQQAFNDWFTMRQDPAMGEQYADKYLDEDAAKFAHMVAQKTDGGDTVADAMVATVAQMGKPLDMQMIPQIAAGTMKKADEYFDKTFNVQGMFSWLTTNKSTTELKLDDPNVQAPLRALTKKYATDAIFTQGGMTSEAAITFGYNKAMNQTELVGGNPLINTNGTKSIAELNGMKKDQLDPAVSTWLQTHGPTVGAWKVSMPGYDTPLDNWSVGQREKMKNDFGLESVILPQNTLIGGPRLPDYYATYNPIANALGIQLYTKADRSEKSQIIWVPMKDIAKEYNDKISSPTTLQQVGHALAQGDGYSLKDDGSKPLIPGLWPGDWFK